VSEVAVIKIADPKKVGDYLIINATDFRPGEHIPWSEEMAVNATAQAEIVFEPQPVEIDFVGTASPMVTPAPATTSDETWATRKRGGKRR
jgi:hypothetical protein